MRKNEVVGQLDLKSPPASGRVAVAIFPSGSPVLKKKRCFRRHRRRTKATEQRQRNRKSRVGLRHCVSPRNAAGGPRINDRWVEMFVKQNLLLNGNDQGNGAQSLEFHYPLHAARLYPPRRRFRSIGTNGEAVCRSPGSPDQAVLVSYSQVPWVWLRHMQELCACGSTVL